MSDLFTKVNKKLDAEWIRKFGTDYSKVLSSLNDLEESDLKGELIFLYAIISDLLHIERAQKIARVNKIFPACMHQPACDFDADAIASACTILEECNCELWELYFIDVYRFKEFNNKGMILLSNPKAKDLCLQIIASVQNDNNAK